MKIMLIPVLLAMIGLAIVQSSPVSPVSHDVSAELSAAVAADDDAVTCEWAECTLPCGSGLRRCDRSNNKTWNINCHVQDCQRLEGCGKADVVFVFDSSASIGEKNWWVTKQFAIDVMKGLTISPNDCRIAAVTYSDHATKQWFFGDKDSSVELEDGLWDLPWESGVTNTQEGLQFAKEIIDSSARMDVKHIVVILTDGASNVHPDLTIPQAEELHQSGIEVFSIGIGNIDLDEVRGIASDPEDIHFNYVAGYDALSQITNNVINETCIAANLTECEEWSEWSECEVLGQCGDGVQSRMKVCHFYLYPGAEPVIRIATETKPCVIACERCARCEFDDYGVGYLPVDENCHLFIQCQRLEDGSFLEIKKSCSELFWRQSILNCDYHKDDGAVCVDGDVVPDNPDGPDESECDKSAGPSDAEYIWHTASGVDYVMPCAPGTVFSEDECVCVHGINGVECNSDAMLQFSFTDDYDDICNRAAGTAWGDMKLEDGAAFFDGASRVEVGYLKNWFAENPTTSMTLSLWFRYTGAGTDFQGLFSNGDCVDEASLLLAVGSDLAQGQVLTDTARANFGEDGTEHRGFPSDEWVFVTLVYSGWDAKYYVNGQMKSQISISGNIANTQCAASIGFSGLNNAQHFFQGYIDDVRVYQKTLYDYDIGVLYGSGRQ